VRWSAKWSRAAVAWHLHAIGVKICAPREFGRPEIRLHNPRRRRPDPPAQANPGGREHGRQAMPARMLAGMIDHWKKNRGLTPKDVPAGEGSAFAEGRGQQTYQALQDRLRILNAADFGDLLLSKHRLFAKTPSTAPIPGAFQIHPGGRISGHQVAQYLWLRLLAQRLFTSPNLKSLSPLARRVDLPEQRKADQARRILHSVSSLRVPLTQPSPATRRGNRKTSAGRRRDKRSMGWPVQR